MFEFTETIVIEAPPPEAWEAVRDIESWWLPSNPEHESLERLDNRGIEVGARIRIREKVAGVRGEAVGEITDLIPGSLVAARQPRNPDSNGPMRTSHPSVIALTVSRQRA